MNTDELKTLLKEHPVLAERNPGCPDDYELASYMDGGLCERDHGRFELHLADCEYCMERVGLLGRAGEADKATHVPEFMPAHATRLLNGQKPENNPDKRGMLHRAPRWAAAALVVLAVGYMLQEFTGNQNIQQPPSAARSPDHTGPVRETRNINLGALAPRFLASHEGMTIVPGDGTFEWTPVPESLYYQLRIVSDEGDLIWQGRVDGTQWALPSDLPLVPGSEYFVRVDAYLAEAKAVNSDYFLFQVGESR